MVAALGFCALLLVYYGLRMHHDFKSIGMSECLPSASGATGRGCSAKAADFHGDQNRVTQLMAAFLPLPLLFGLFIGAPLLAREYESGTYRFAFTQGASRTTWLITKVTVLVAFTVLTATAFTCLVMWWYAPLVPLDGRVGQTGIPEIYGAVFVARAVFALAVGVLAGAVLRRVVPAIGVTLAVWVAVVVPSVVALRPHLLTPVTAVNEVNPVNSMLGDIISDMWKAPTGAVLNNEQVSDTLYNASAAGHKLDAYQYLYQQGYVQTVVYQPASRFWALQFIEAGGLVVLSLGFLLAAIWIVRRRAA
jgi:ABC-type transport system involved in multi-copper enzyme maturation permease subunit